MTTPSKKLLTIVCGLAAVLTGTGCQQQNQQSTANGPHIILATPQQRQNDIDTNNHIPAAQKATINAQLARETQLKAQATPTGSH